MIILKIKIFLLLFYNFLITKLEIIPYLNYQTRIIERKIKFFLRYHFLFKEIIQLINCINFSDNFIKQKLPNWAGIEITNFCNLNCIMCNTQLSKRSRGYMSPEMFKMILKELTKIGIHKVAIHTLGEPFMYKDLNILFKIIKENNFKVYLSTNGQFPEKLRDIIYNFSDSIEFIRFSIDGARSETYEKIRKGGKFNKLLQSLDIVRKFNNNKIDYRIRVRIDSILSLTNIDEISLFFKTFREYAWPESINFNIVSGLSPDTKYFWEAFPFPNLIRKMIPCRYPFYAIHFTYEGKVTLCCEDFNGELIVGDLKECSLIEIWNGNNSELIRKQHLNLKKLNINSCTKCYGPYTFLSTLVNIYIHFLYYNNPNLSNYKFGKKILDLLTDLNNNIKNEDKHMLMRVVLNYFYVKNHFK